MQIRLTVALEPRGGGRRPGGGAEAACDVLVTAPAGTVLAAVTGALASTAAAASAASAAGGDTGEAAREHAQESVAVYAGEERLDPHRQMIGEPPLLDGAVIALHGPVAPAAVPAHGPCLARLHIVAGPDAGGIHLLQGGAVRLGRSTEADVPLDDPDVSRLHCAVTVTDSGAVTVTDLGSTNGTTLDGVPVGSAPVVFHPGATLTLGESVVRLEATADPGAGPYGLPAGPMTLPTVPDGSGRLRLTPGSVAGSGADGGSGAGAGVLPGQAGAVVGGAPPVHAAGGASGAFLGDGGTHGAGVAPRRPAEPPAYPAPGSGAPGSGAPGSGAAAQQYGPDGQPERRRARGIGAWARRLTGSRASEDSRPGGQPSEAPVSGLPLPESPGVQDAGPAGSTGPAGPANGPTGAPRSASASGGPGSVGAPDGHGHPAALPDPAAVLLTALGPGPRLWEREAGHPEALTVRLGSAHHPGGRPGAPVTVDLRTAGALGLAGPRDRLAGLARWVITQLAAAHGPSSLEIVLLAADRTRSVESRTAEWSWLGWLPHVRPAHGQDCRLLTAYDGEQAAARTAELTRRLEEERRVAEERRLASASGAGPFTLLVVDGDPGPAVVRDTVARLAAEGPGAGIHVLCLAETPPATPSSPLATTTEAAYAASPAFRECGALGVLSGAVATAVRVVRRHPDPDPDPHGAGGGTVATVDGVSVAWAERFARALAPLREPEEPDGPAGSAARPVVTLPRTSRLLDELGLARATPAALRARWPDPGSVQPGRASLVFGAGPRGPVEAQLTATHGHALISGPAGTGKTELLRSLAASLAAGERPDRLRLLLVDGDGGGPREDLRVCGELPHVAGHLAADDPVRMREFAQSLSAELKQRAELFGEGGSYEEYVRHGGHPAPRVVPPRTSPEARGQAADQEPGRTVDRRADQEPSAGRAGRAYEGGSAGGQEQAGGAADLELEATRGTLRLRPRRQHTGHSGESRTAGSGTGESGVGGSAALPRLVILVDDFDTLVDPALGNPGRPAAGSVVRALESVARDGARLGVHLVAATGRPERTAGTEVARTAVAALRAGLTATASEGEVSGDGPVPGRGTLTAPDGSGIAFQAGRVTGRIPRTSTLRPTVVPVDWARAGDPPTRRPVRELGNGPTDLALLASAIGRAAQSAPPTGQGADARSRSGQEGALDS